MPKVRIEKVGRIKLGLWDSVVNALGMDNKELLSILWFMVLLMALFAVVREVRALRRLANRDRLLRQAEKNK